MAEDNSTPQGGTPPESTPSEGTGTPAPTTPSGSSTPTVPTDAAQAAEYWKNRHEEATKTITRTTQKNARYRDMYGDLEDDAAPAQPQGQTPATPPNSNFVPKEQYESDRLRDQIGKTHPALVEHADSVSKLVKAGIKYDTAIRSVAMEHNITLGPSSQPDIEGMPTTPAGGGAPSSGGSGLSREHEESLGREGIPVEAAKKAMPAIQKAWANAK